MDVRVRVNHTMLELLGGDPEFFEPSDIRLPIGLEQVAAMGFAEIDGCVVPKAVSEAELERLRVTFTNDETGIEALLSHVHIEQYLSNRPVLHELARLGLDYAFLLQRELVRSSLPGPFRVVVSASGTDSREDDNATCTVRYHRRREGQVWLDEDLERYCDEGIAVLDIE